MEAHALTKLMVSIGVILLFGIISQLLKRYAKKTQVNFNLTRSRYYSLKHIIYVSNSIIAIIILVMIWGVDIMDLWISITGILAMVAIGLVATWSLLANALAGIILYFVSPFRTEDNIEILPDNIKGKVVTINLFYTILTDENENNINVPNTLFYLKYIKVIKRKS